MKLHHFLLIIIVLIAGGAVFEHISQQQDLSRDEDTIKDQNDKITALQSAGDKLAQDEQKISDQDASIKSLQEENQKLTTENNALTVSLDEAKAKITTLTQAANQAATAPSPAVASTPAAPTPPPAPTKLTADQMSQGVVVIKGDNAEGTGFLVKTPDGPVVVTNLHVLANNPNFKIYTNGGAQIIPTGMKGAVDRDLAMLSIKDGPYTYIPMATDVGQTAKTGDEVLTPGNSQGGNVVLSTKGKLLALGPDRIEFDNPIYHGNSGGPVFHSDSGTVLGVVTEAMQVDVSNDLDKTSFKSRNSAIASSVRYFGLRLDTATKWEPYDPNRYETETTLLDNFDDQSRRLDSYLNPPVQADDKKGKGAAASDSDDADAKLYLSDTKIVDAETSFEQKLNNGSDTSSQIDALRDLCFALETIADKDVQKLQNPYNFYSFDQLRAKDELAYRKALITEIQDFSNDVSRIGRLPRTNTSDSGNGN